MRNTILSLLLASAGAIGLAGSESVAAQERIFIGSGDVVFSYGRPYWRHDRSAPLYVVYDRGYPRYYRYAAPRYGYSYSRPYEPRWRDPRRTGRYYGPVRYDYGYDRRWRRERDWDRDVVIEYRDWD